MNIHRQDNATHHTPQHTRRTRKYLRFLYMREFPPKTWTSSNPFLSGNKTLKKPQIRPWLCMGYGDGQKLDPKKHPRKPEISTLHKSRLRKQIHAAKIALLVSDRCAAQHCLPTAVKMGIPLHSERFDVLHLPPPPTHTPPPPHHHPTPLQPPHITPFRHPK